MPPNMQRFKTKHRWPEAAESNSPTRHHWELEPTGSPSFLITVPKSRIMRLVSVAVTTGLLSILLSDYLTSKELLRLKFLNTKDSISEPMPTIKSITG